MSNGWDDPAMQPIPTMHPMIGLLKDAGVPGLKRLGPVDAVRWNEWTVPAWIYEIIAGDWDVTQRRRLLVVRCIKEHPDRLRAAWRLGGEEAAREVLCTMLKGK